jgi:RNA polymerase sigma-70 factor, ECF subfamily
MNAAHSVPMYPSTPAGRQFSEDLLQSCREGDERAWGRLFQAASPVIYAICRQDFHLHTEDAEDVVQTVHLKLYEHLQELREAASFVTWLRRVTRHTIIDLLRQKRQTLSLEALSDETGLEVPERLTPLGSGLGDREADVAGARVAARLDLQRALASLPPLYREPVLYYLVDEKPQDEIGNLLHRPRSTVATQIQRGLEKLRRSLEGAYGEGVMNWAPSRPWDICQHWRQPRCNSRLLEYLSDPWPRRPGGGSSGWSSSSWVRGNWRSTSG